MRRGVAWAVTVIGTLVALVGLVVAVVVGPDDTVARSPDGLPGGGADTTLAYSSWPQLFAYRDLTLVVTARGDGQVFLGTANPLDAASYASGVRSYRYFELTSSGRVGAGRTGGADRTRPAVAPRRATFWQTKASGSGEARLTVPLDGTPVRVVASAERGPLELGFGVRFAGLFWTALGTLLVGLLLCGAGTWRLRRDSALTRPADQPAGPGAPGRTAGLTGGGVALLLLVSGCGWVPQAVEPRTPSRTPMTEAGFQSMLEDFDRRDNAAVEAADLRFDEKAWRASRTGALLAVEQFDTRYRRLANDKGEGVGQSTGALRLYAPTVSSYPMTFVGTDQDAAANDDDVSLDIFSQACVTCPWKLAVTVSLPRADQPTPGSRVAPRCPPHVSARWPRTSRRTSPAT